MPISLDCARADIADLLVWRSSWRIDKPPSFLKKIKVVLLLGVFFALSSETLNVWLIKLW